MTDEALRREPLVSVIVPVYNGERYIETTLASAAAQTLPSLEIVAVDDGSRDGSGAILGHLARQDRRLKVLSVPNGGVSRARNLGAESSRGRYLAFLDQDDLWTPDKLARQISLLESSAETALVYSNFSTIDGSGNVIEQRSLQRGDCRRGMVFEHLLFHNFIPISSVVVRRGIFESVGGFDSRYGLSEDLDLLLRIARTSPIDCIDEPLLQYRVHETNASSNVRRINAETEEIVGGWRRKEPGLFRRHPLRYLRFKGNLRYMEARAGLARRH